MKTILFHYRASFVATLVAGNLVAWVAAPALANSRLYILPLLALIVASCILVVWHTHYFQQRQMEQPKLRLALFADILLFPAFVILPSLIMHLAPWQAQPQVVLNGFLFVLLLWPLLVAGTYTPERMEELDQQARNGS